jgi:glycosyltransferase involved in cell wall biosynthesis
MDEVFFSIIIPVYNREKYILQAVQSVISQTFTNWELIIVNDASTDSTATLINNINHPKVVVVHNKQNIERCNSRNLGIALAKGKYIAFLDSDDYHLPFHLQKLHDFIASKNYAEALFFSNAFDETADGKRTNRLCPTFEQFNPYTYFLTYTVNPQRWAVHRNVFEKVKFDPNVTICEDMDTSMRIVAAGFKCYQLEERTTVYVAAPDSFTHGDDAKAEKELFYLNRIFKKEELKNKLPLVPRLRLISMCHFHIAVKKQKQRKITAMYQHILLSFFLYPPGYNRKTNLPMLVMFLYELPLLNIIFKFLAKKRKNINSKLSL